MSYTGSRTSMRYMLRTTIKIYIIKLRSSYRSYNLSISTHLAILAASLSFPKLPVHQSLQLAYLEVEEPSIHHPESQMCYFEAVFALLAYLGL